MRLALAALALCLIPRVAGADAKADCNFLEIAATNDKAAALDPDLKPLEKKLTKPPFSSYNVFHKLSSGSVTLTHLKAETLPLKQGGASLLLREKTDKRAELTVTMDGADGKRALELKQGMALGEWTLAVAQGKDSAHILALTCK